MKNGGDILNGSLQFRIYLINTAKSDFGTGAMNWIAEARDSNLTLVYDANPKTVVGTTAGFFRFDFDQVPYFVFDTTGGASAGGIYPTSQSTQPHFVVR